MNILMQRNILRIVLAALACVALLINASGASGRLPDNTPDAAKPLPFEPDEELIYQADYTKLIIRGVEIAEFRFTTGRASASPGTDASQAPANIVFKGDARARGMFRKLFGLDFHYSHESIVDPANFLIIRTTKLDEQGKRVRASVAEFDRKADRVTWTQRNPNDANASPRVVTNTLRDAAHDFISALYYLRTQPLAPGQNLELVISDDGQTYRIPVKVYERKVMKSVVGRAPTLRLNIGLFGAGRLIDDRKGTMTLWLTDDARRLPVRARIDADIGTLDIKLKKVTGGISRQK
ncbi:MAG: hypothetical protein QOF61_1800 [Acidobacteriota bacterium]|jgi:hypothetical protein|nr:hypothetical protein [Acidobacteriota bacterium]